MTTTSGQQGVSSRRRLVAVALILLCQSFQALAFGGIGLFLPRIRNDLGISFTQAGTLSAASTLVYALMQIPSGYLADRFGPKRLFIIGLIGTNILAFNLGLLHHYWQILPNQAVSGFFRALVFAPGLVLVASWFPPERRATAMGLYVAGGFSSSIFLNSTGPFLVDSLGWRVLFMAFATGGLLIMATYAKFGGDGPVGSNRQSVPVTTVLRLFRYKVMWIIGGIQYIRLAVAFGMNFWMASFIVDERGHSLQLAGAIIAVGAALTAPSNFLGGYLSDRLRNPFVVIGGSLSMLALTNALLPHVHALPLLIAVILFNAVFIQLYFGPLFAVPIDMLGPRTAGMASGFGNFFANMGGFTFAYSLGAIKDRTGSFAIGFYSLSAICVAGVILTIALARMARAGVHMEGVLNASPAPAAGG